VTPPKGEAGRGPGASGGEAPAPSGAAIALVLFAALLLRVAVAFVLFPNGGFATDVSSFEAWALTLARYGPGGFYQHAGFADYAPGYLYILWVVGAVYRVLAPLVGGDPSFGLLAALDKLPAILFDLAIGYLIYRTLLRWRGERIALIGAALFVFNPVTWYVSALWGQVDSVGTFVLLVTVLLLIGGWSEAAAGTAVLAALIKPQYAIVLVIVGFVLLSRHLVRPGTGPRPRLDRPWLARLDAALDGWFTREQGPWRLVSSAAVALLVLFVVITPFDLGEMASATVPQLPISGDLGGLAVIYARAAGEYHYLTINAYNPWALIGDQSLARTWLWNAQSDYATGFAGFPWFWIGSALLAAGIAGTGYAFLRRTDRTSLLVTTTVLALAFFVLPTRVHERYLFPAFAVGALLAAGSTSWRWWYAALATGTLVNIHGVLTYPLFGTRNVVALPFGELFRSEPVVTLVALWMTALFAIAAWQLARRLGLGARSAPVIAARATAPMVWRTPWTPMPPPQSLAPPEQVRSAASASRSAVAATRGDAFDGPEDDLDDARPRSSRERESVPAPSWTEVGIGTTRIWSAVRDRLSLGSIRPDRSVLLRGEPGGRLDRLDALAVVLIFVIGMTLRGTRADQPFQAVTLDELYHPRTAAEFLQDWRYGIPHSIYEYTHPHLAKYLMALGIVALGDNQVVATSDLGTPVRSVALEHRYAAFERPGQRTGDRLFVATGTEVRVIDLRSDEDEARIPVAATAVGVDESEHVVYAAGDGGVIWSLDTGTLDRWRDIGGGVQDASPIEVGRVNRPVDRLWPVGGDRLVVASGDELMTVDATSGDVIATRTVRGLGAAIVSDPVTTVVAHPEEITATGPAASILAEALGLDEASIRAQLTASDSPRSGVRLASYVTSEQRNAVQQALDDGRLSGVDIEDRNTLVATLPTGLSVLDGTSLDEIGHVDTEATARGMDVVGEGGDRRLYVALDDQRIQIFKLATDGPPTTSDMMPMPGSVSDVRWDKATNLVHVLGETPTGQPTVYVIETHGNSVFADAALPFTPAAWALDVQADYASSDRERGLVFGADGKTATIDIGRNTFAWRFPGILLGVLMAVALYLLARILFRRRSVAVLTAVAALADGMLFAHSRDAMNDAYVGFFIVAAAAALAWLWMPGTARRRTVTVAIGLLVLGVLLGLALASKWAGAFAMGAAVLIVLMRSAVGRVIALAGLVVLAGILGNLALATGNVTFGLVMLVVVLAIAAAMAWHPIAWSPEELRFAAFAPAVIGVVLLVAGASGRLTLGTVTLAGFSVPFLIAGGLSFLALAVVAGVGARVAAATGVLPVARDAHEGDRALAADDDEPSAPAPRGWLRPGVGLGVPLAYALVCLVVVPLVVYVASYVPWARPWDADCSLPVNTCPQIIPATLSSDGQTTITDGWPSGHRGQTLYDLTIGMYNYHNDLRATHPATSPWWAWPLDLKPVWLFQEPHGAGTTAVIFDAGNLVLWWLSVPAIAFGLWQAFRRRSLPLAFVGVFFLAQWLSWARIDRATFQYHYYTALPFAMLFLGYFLAELWNGPSRATWLLTRVATAIAILGPGLMWLAKDPLCTLGGVTSVAPSSYLCTTASGTFAIPVSLIATVGTLVVALAVVAREVFVMRAPARGNGAGSGPGSVGGLPGAAVLRLAAVAIAAGLAVTLVPRIVGSGTITLSANIGQAWVVAVAYLLGAAAFAWLALGARDPRRAVVLIMISAVAWFVVFYPYIADLPLPSGLVFIYQRLLPTWDYSFQFAVNRAASPKVGFFDPQGLVLVGSIGLATLVAWLLVRQWRLDRRAYLAELEGDGREPAAP
jgi:Gpi18-like mannosyltransferase/predicted membrane-bound dolichyl-phosphate-mannose-protein mannosyltransferase